VPYSAAENSSAIQSSITAPPLTSDPTKKLDILGKTLDDRSALKMDIMGHVDLKRDLEGLKQYLLYRKVKAQKVKDFTKRVGRRPPSILPR
jgi:hypothetical protein